MDVGGLAVDSSPEVVTAVLGTPDVAVRVKSQRDFVTQTVGQHLTLGVKGVAISRCGAYVKHLDDSTPDTGVDGRVVPVRVGTDGDED